MTSEAQGEPSIYSSGCSDLSVIATTIASIFFFPQSASGMINRVRADMMQLLVNIGSSLKHT